MSGAGAVAVSGGAALQSKQQLALRIIGDHFGATVQSIAQIIADSEFASLSHIYRTARLRLNLAACNATGSNFYVFADDNSAQQSKTSAARFVPIKTDASGTAAGKQTPIDAHSVRQAVLTLLFNFCAVAELPADVPNDSDAVGTGAAAAAAANAVDSTLLYRLQLDNIINRMRFPRLLEVVRAKYRCRSYTQMLQRQSTAAAAAVLDETAVDTFSGCAESILELVMLRGHCKESTLLDQLSTAHAAAQQQQQQQWGSAGDAAVISRCRQHVKSVFDQLARDRFLVVCPQLSPQRRVAAVREAGRGSSKKSLLDIPLATAGNSNSNSSNSHSGSSRVKAEPGQQTTAAAAAGKRGVKRSAETEQQQLETTRARNTVKRSRNNNNSSSSSGAAVAAAASSLPVELLHLMGQQSNHNSTAAVNGKSSEQNHIFFASRLNAAVRSTVDAEEYEFDPATSVTTAATTTAAAATATTGLWMIGWEQLLREERHSACVHLVQQQHKSAAGFILRSALRKSMPQERSARQLKSAEVSVQQIHELMLQDHREQAELRRKVKSVAAAAAVPQQLFTAEVIPDVATVKQLLEYLRLSSDNPVIKVVGSELDEGGPSYLVNFESLIGTLRRRTVHQIAWERFGPAPARIVELLQRHKFLEQKDVKDLAILPARETQQLLYKLHLDKWVEYVELSKRNDFNPTTNLYYWFLDAAKLKARILEHLYLTANNILIRRAHEYEKGGSLFEYNNSSSERNGDPLQHHVLRRRISVLDLALQNLDRTILLMEHF